MGVFLHGLELANYRGIGPEPQRIAPLRDFNIFVGANNSGKSTILNFIVNHLPVTKDNNFLRNLAETDRFRGQAAGSVAVRFAFPESGLDWLRERIGRPNTRPQRPLTDLIETLPEDGLVWCAAKPDNHGGIALNLELSETQVNRLEPATWHQLRQILTNRSGGSFEQHWLPETLAAFAQHFSIPNTATHLIPAKRQIGPKGEERTDWSGRGLIDQLAEHQNPGFQEQDKKAIFAKINAFLQDVTAKPKARIEIPADRAHILVHMDAKVLPLASLGTGIHEVILIAATCTIQNNEIICIEEPEIHLHPVLQRKLINYLKDHTSNQYFIATHSAAFIDMQGACVFHVENDGQQTRVRPVSLKDDLRHVCDDLGYRASDLVQSNAIVWVEGPSDRIYLQHWLSAKAPELVEGIHFTIMFYGGRLLSHLSADSEEVGNFIDLLALNRNTALLMDSDKSKAHARLNATKTRIKNELERGGGFFWVTQGREVENYVAPGTLGKVLAGLCPDMKLPTGDTRYQRMLDGKKLGKVKVARAVAELEVDLSPYDLTNRLGELAAFIRNANGLAK